MTAAVAVTGMRRQRNDRLGRTAVASRARCGYPAPPAAPGLRLFAGLGDLLAGEPLPCGCTPHPRSACAYGDRPRPPLIRRGGQSLAPLCPDEPTSSR